VKWYGKYRRKVSWMNFHIISLFNLPFFHIVHILSLFDLPCFHMFHIDRKFTRNTTTSFTNSNVWNPSVGYRHSSVSIWGGGATGSMFCACPDFPRVFFLTIVVAIPLCMTDMATDVTWLEVCSAHARKWGHCTEICVVTC
jgi:hypothetical protein